MRCPHCDHEINEDVKYCPYCGKLVKSKNAEFTCSYCHNEISKDDEICPHCQKRVKLSDRLSSLEKKGFLALVLVAAGFASFIVPAISFPLLGIGCYFGYKDKDKDHRAKDAFIMSIIGLVLEAIVFIINLINVIQNMNLLK